MSTVGLTVVVATGGYVAGRGWGQWPWDVHRGTRRGGRSRGLRRLQGLGHRSWWLCRWRPRQRCNRRRRRYRRRGCHGRLRRVVREIQRHHRVAIVIRTRHVPRPPDATAWDRIQTPVRALVTSRRHLMYQCLRYLRTQDAIVVGIEITVTRQERRRGRASVDALPHKVRQCLLGLIGVRRRRRRQRRRRRRRWLSALSPSPSRRPRPRRRKRTWTTWTTCRTCKGLIVSSFISHFSLEWF